MISLNDLERDFPEKVVNAINSAVTDDIKKDIRDSNLSRQDMNSYAARIWDLVNRNTDLAFKNDASIITGITTRGPWKLRPVFDKKSGIIFTIMREERFYSVRKDPQNRKHYIGELACGLNHDLENLQQTLLEKPPIDEKIVATIKKISNDLSLSSDMIKNHAIILFSSTEDILKSVRCIMINPMFEECVSVSWNNFIKIRDSVIVDKISEPESKFNDPTHGLSLTAKAKKRKGTHSNLSEKNNNEKAQAE